MKIAEDLIRVLAEEVKQIPKRYIYLGLALYYGLFVVVAAIYVIDWLLHNGSRTELLILLDKL